MKLVFWGLASLTPGTEPPSAAPIPLVRTTLPPIDFPWPNHAAALNGNGLPRGKRLFALILSSLIALDATAAPDTVVVVPPHLRAALQPWVEYRTAQGHRLVFVESWASSEALRAEIRRHAGARLRSVVLVGDAGPSTAAFGEQVGPPPHFARSNVTRQWGAEPEIATDNWYADLDDDHIPDLSVGRLPADSPAELKMMVERVFAYESVGHRGPWQRRLNFVAGVGGFGPLADAVLETATKKFLTEGIPAEYNVSMTYSSWRSQYCPDPRRFSETVVDRFNEGCLFWVYLGHGQRRFLDPLRVPGGAYRILDTDDVGKLHAASRPPIAVFLSCYSGAFDDPRDCLAEAMLCSPGGPVAALAGSRVTMPYAMAVFGNQLLSEYFNARRATIGELVLHAKKAMAAASRDGEADSNRRLLDALAKAISPSREQLDAERLEHVHLFNLLGDPLMRLPHLESIEVKVAPNVIAGDELVVNWNSAVGGEGTIELVCRRDRSRMARPIRRQFLPTDQAMYSYGEAYQQSNDRRWVTSKVECGVGEFSATMRIPAEASGPCHVRIFVDGEPRCAAGAANVFVRRRPKPLARNGPAKE